MNTLPPYSGDEPTCMKCGNVGASTEYLPLGDCVHSPGDRGVTLGWTPNERLHRECQRCQYQWDEATVEPEHRGGNAEEEPAEGCTSTTRNGYLLHACIMPARHTEPHADGSSLRWTAGAEETP